MQNIDSDLIRGNIDTIILKTMLNEDKYGLDIIKEVEQRSNGTYELKQPTLYSCLKRLENQELISSYWLNSDIGGRRHYYKLTDKGREFYNKKQEEWAKSKFVIDNLLSSFNYEEYRLVKKDEYDKVINAAAASEDTTSAENALEETDFEDEPLENMTDNESQNDKILDESEAETYSDDENDNNEDIELEENDEIAETEEVIPSDEVQDEDSDEDFSFDLGSNNESDYDDESAEEDDYFEETIGESSEDEENDETEDDQHIYVSNVSSVLDEEYDDADEDNESEDDNINEDSHPTYELEDQTQNESNILNMLRRQDNEEINTYEGDKKSYAHQIKSIYDDVKYVQDDMAFSGTNEEDEVDQKIKEFTDAANRLNEFDSSLENEEENEFDEQEPTFEQEDFDESESESFENNEDEQENEQFASEIEDKNYESFDFNDESDNEDDLELDESNDEDEDESINFGLNFDEDENNEAEDENSEADDEKEFNFSESDDNEANDELENYGYDADESQNSSFFSASDTAYDTFNQVQNEFEEKNYQEQDETENYDESYSNYQNNNKYNNDFSPAEFEPFKNSKFNQDEYDSTFVNVRKDPQPEPEYFDENSLNNSDIDSIISKNASSMNDNIAQNSLFESRYMHENYKQKLSNLTVYSKATTDSQEKTFKTEEPAEADDLETLKLNFEQEGIKVKEYKKISSFEEPEKTYLLTNKINLIKSVILLLGYVFLLSGMYIILKNTSFSVLCEDFQINYFLIGIIPFAIIALYHLIVYIINPYKKIPAKFASRIMIFIAIILTVQLLLITYCVNLQLGFYSFTQAGYNHLLWIIPSLLSFGPIFSHIIYTALFHSGNFNV